MKQMTFIDTVYAGKRNLWMPRIDLLANAGGGALVIWPIAAAGCLWRLEIQKLEDDLVIFDRFAAFKIDRV